MLTDPFPDGSVVSFQQPFILILECTCARDAFPQSLWKSPR